MTVAPPRPIKLRSTRSTRAPERDASIAAYMPAPPDPMIRTSVSTCMVSAVMVHIVARIERLRSIRGAPIPDFVRTKSGLQPLALARRNLHRFDNFRIGGATAEIAGEIVPDVVLARIRIRIEKLRRHQQKTRRAISALKSTGLDECFLFRTELVALGEMLDSSHLGAIEKASKVKAAGNGSAVHQNRAAAAHSLPAALARAGPVELALQQFDDIVIRLHFGRNRLAVESEADGASAWHAHRLDRRVGKARNDALSAWAKSCARFAHADRSGRPILPTLRIHSLCIGLPSLACSARRIASGLSGNSVRRMPQASVMALAMAGDTQKVAVSPTPLPPNGPFD